MIGIYRITSPSGRIYIGQSVDIEKRFSYYKSLANKTQIKLMRSFLKYGFVNHNFEVLEECLIEELNNKERYYQILFNSIEKGLNCILVGNENYPNTRSEEYKKSLSKRKTGVKLSLEVRKNISIGRMGMKFKTTHCENIRKSKTGSKNKRSIKVKNIITGDLFDCIADAAKQNNIDHRTLSRYLNGTRTNKTNLVYA